MYGLRCSLRRDSAKQRRKMRRRKEGKVPPLLTLQHVPPEAYLLAYEQALLRFPGVRGWGRKEGPGRACSQDTYLQAIHI